MINELMAITMAADLVPRSLNFLDNTGRLLGNPA
jgi:hypothetical protein